MMNNTLASWRFFKALRVRHYAAEYIVKETNNTMFGRKGVIYAMEVMVVYDMTALSFISCFSPGPFISFALFRYLCRSYSQGCSLKQDPRIWPKRIRRSRQRHLRHLCCRFIDLMSEIWWIVLGLCVERVRESSMRVKS